MRVMPERAEFRWGRLCIQFDRDYGIVNRTGWSVAWRGSFAVQLERWLVVGLFKAWRSVRTWECDA